MKALLKFSIVGVIFSAHFGCGGGSSELKIKTPDTVMTFSNQKIINGTPVIRSDSPQIVKINLTFPDGTQGLCSGTVIGDNDILTAGHCFASGVQSANIERSDGSTVALSSVIIHGGYRVSGEVNAIFNDVAIAKSVTGLGLPALGIVVSKTVTSEDTIGIWGYGLDENQLVGTLKMGSMQVNNVTENHIFSIFNELSNTCNGDSGGPATLALNDETGAVSSVGVVGIVSSGSLTDCGSGDLSLFTNVQSEELQEFILRYVPEAVLL